MKKKIRYTKGEIGDVKLVRDFLPPPAQFIFKEDNIKVTIALSKHSVDFFKKQARRNHMQYQKIIRRLLDYYAVKHEEMPLISR
ncbi:MAG: CopG family transcriptional regulator [Elusimicrobiota bacterium]|nr:CopG family transcriptional regulator [Elusimicrobiota bacterium]